MKQDDIIQALNSAAAELEIDIKMTQPRISRIINNKENITFQLAIVMSSIFPKKQVTEWRNSTGEEFKAAWKQYQPAKEVA